MNPFDPIVVAYNGSPSAQAAVGMAQQLPTARTVLVWASEDAGPERRATMEAAAAAFSKPVGLRIVQGASTQVLVEAELLNAGLVIVGTRDRSALTARLLGSTTREFLRSCKRPLLVVHGTAAPIKKILVGVDGGPAAVEVARYARTLADLCGASLTVATVINAPTSVLREPERFGIDSAIWQDAIRMQGERAFGPVREALGAGTNEVTLFGEPAIELTELARRESYDVVVVGRRGRSGHDMDAFFSVGFSLATAGPFASLIV